MDKKLKERIKVYYYSVDLREKRTAIKGAERRFNVPYHKALKVYKEFRREYRRLPAREILKKQNKNYSKEKDKSLKSSNIRNVDDYIEYYYSHNRSEMSYTAIREISYGLMESTLGTVVEQKRYTYEEVWRIYYSIRKMDFFKERRRNRGA